MYAINRAKPYPHNQEPEQKPTSQQIECAAYGCPLPGGMTSTIGPGATFWCRFHFQAGPENRDKISHKLRMNLPLIWHLQAMQILASDAYWMLSDEYQEERQQAYQFADYPKPAGIDHYAYIEALSGELRRRVYLTPGEGREKATRTLTEPKLATLIGRISNLLRLPPQDCP